MDHSSGEGEVIPFDPVAEPAQFDKACRQKGKAWIAQNPRSSRSKGVKLPAHWQQFTSDLGAGFRSLCGYAAMHVPAGGTVDHYIAVTSDESQAYEWDNYRFASELMNKRKGVQDDEVLDPFEVRDGWFEVSLPDLQLRVSERVPANLRPKAEHTLTALKLRDHETMIRWRRSWFELYESGELTLDGLRMRAPLIAEAVDRRMASGAPR
jgi:hypothetical protein